MEGACLVVRSEDPGFSGALRSFIPGDGSRKRDLTQKSLRRPMHGHLTIEMGQCLGPDLLYRKRGQAALSLSKFSKRERQRFWQWRKTLLTLSREVVWDEVGLWVGTTSGETDGVA